MTVAPTQGSELTIQQHVQLAYQTLGVLEASQMPNTADLTLGKRHLQNILNGLERYGLFAHAIAIESMRLVADQASYDLPSGVSSVTGTAMYVPVGSDGNDKLAVTPLTIEEWQTIGSKGSSGTPSLYWHDRYAKKLWLWLIPEEAGALEYQAVRKLADTSPATATLDLEQFWDEWINLALAAKLAPSKSQFDKVGFFQGEAAQMLELNRARGTQHKAEPIRLRHRVRY